MKNVQKNGHGHDDLFGLSHEGFELVTKKKSKNQYKRARC